MLLSSGKEVCLWNLDKFELVKEYPLVNRLKKRSSINYLSVRNDNNQIASVVDNDFISLVNFENDSVVDLKDLADARCCSYDSTSRLLAVGTKSGSIDLLDLKSQTMKKKSYKIMENTAINCLAWSKNDRYIATGNANGSIVVFNTLVNQISKPWISPYSKSLTNNSVSCLQYSPGNVANLASAYEDGSVILWDSAKEAPIASFKNHTSLCTSVVISSVNQVLMISGGLDSVISLYDTANKKVLKTIQCNAGVTSIDLLKDGATLAVGQINGDVHVFDLRAKVDEPLLSKKCHDTSVFCVKFVQKTSYNMMSRVNSGSNVNSLPVNMSSLEQANSTSIKKSSSYNQDLHNNTSSTQLSAPKPTYNLYSPEVPTNYKPNTMMQTTASDLYSPIRHDSLKMDTSELKTDQLRRDISASSLNSMRGPKLNSTEYQKTPKSSSSSSQMTNLNLFSPLNGSAQSASLAPSATTVVNNSSAFASNTEPERVKDSPNEHNRTLQQQQQQQQQSAKSQQQAQSSQLQMPIDQIREIIKDTVEDFKDELMSENFKFKAEMFKEFMNLKKELMAKVEECSLNFALVEEIARLKEENKRLRKNF